MRKSPHRCAVRTFACSLQTELLVETVYASTSIDQLLLAGIEGVTLRANFDLDILLRGPGLNHRAACTTDRGLLIVGMDAFLHAVHLFLGS